MHVTRSNHHWLGSGSGVWGEGDDVVVATTPPLSRGNYYGYDYHEAETPMSFRDNHSSQKQDHDLCHRRNDGDDYRNDDKKYTSMLHQGHRSCRLSCCFISIFCTLGPPHVQYGRAQARGAPAFRLWTRLPTRVWALSTRLIS